MRGKEKGRPVYDLDELAAAAGGHWLILTGCRKGTVPHGAGHAAARRPPAREIDRLVDAVRPRTTSWSS